MRLEDRRNAEIARYTPEYWGVMRVWRQDIVRDWLKTAKDMVPSRPTYLDVGCGKWEAIALGESLKYHARGAEVQDWLCAHPAVDLIPGAHDLSRYVTDAFDVVTCNDCLEHVLEEDIPAALSEISRVAKTAILLGISQKPGPWHVCIQSTEWWLDAIGEHMAGRAVVVFDDRIPPVKRPYLWVSITR